MKRIGLLGGSFNPAHAGHRRISLAAMNALGLDEVWWLDQADDVRRERLVARHVRFGKTLDEARAWVARVDDVNAELVARTLSLTSPLRSAPPE